MAIRKVVAYLCVCRCTYEWLVRRKPDAPLSCPRCKSRYWNSPRVRAQR